MNEFDKKLEEEINAIAIESRARGFASSKAIIYETDFTKIVAHAFHVPNHKTGEIHHFDLKINKFVRKTTKEAYKMKIDCIEHYNYGDFQSLKIDLGRNGKAVKNLTSFLNAQFEQIGQKIETTKIIIDKPEEIDVNDFIKSISLNKKEEISYGIKIENLKNYKKFLKDSLDKNETFIQNWLDEDEGKHRKQRCLIFGLEFINHKREGLLSSKRFDILTKMSLTDNEYVIFELKSPNSDVFKIYNEEENKNEGKTNKYKLSDDLARSIPQILNYKTLFEEKKDDDEDLQRVGIKSGKVSKCIILIGTRKEDPIWEKNFRNIKSNFSNTLEIWTYSDLINKLEITIKNLEENCN